MRRGSKIAIIVVAPLLIGAILYVVRTLAWLNAFRTITPHFAGTCVSVPGVLGAEDVEVDPAADVAYLSATDRHSGHAGRPHAPLLDGIYRLPLGVVSETGAAQQPQHLPVHEFEDFHPHGISLHRLPDGGLLLFAVNHNRTDHTVEILRVEDDHLVHLETVRDALLVSPNDVVALRPRSFYVTNDRAKPRVQGAGQLYRDIVLRNSPTTVVLWDGEAASVAATDVKGANGIALSGDGRKVYVSGSLGNDLLVFERDEGDRLTLRESIPLGSSPDNVAVGPDGRLLIAGHPSLYQLLMARRTTPWGLIPSQVIAFAPSARGKNRVEEIYMNRGEEISNVTVAAPFGTHGLIMGTAFDEGVLVCQTAASAR